MFAAHNMMLSLSPTVVFDAAGVGATSVGSGTPTSLTWTHTATAGAYALVAFVTSSGGGAITAVTYDGLTMTLLASISLSNNSTFGTLYLYGKAGVPGGAKTVVTSWTGGAFASAGSVSYMNVGVVGTPATTSGADAAPTQTISGALRGMVFNVQSFFGNGSVTRSSSSGGTQRYAGQPSNLFMGTVIQDSALLSGATFASVLSGSSQWGSIAVLLNAA